MTNYFKYDLFVNIVDALTDQNLLAEIALNATKRDIRAK